MDCQRRHLIALLSALALAPRAWARDMPPPELSAELAGARVQGQGRLRFFGMRVYDVRLWTTGPLAATDWENAALALEIEYARSVSGRTIAERSLDEMRRQAPIAEAQGQRWLAAMNEVFPDVREGDRLTGVTRPGESARFFFNGEFTGEVRDAEFARRFFGIWLSDRTSEPALRLALLGGAPTNR
jgi:hypothetical protein